MPNPHTKWRVDFARRLAIDLTTFEGVQAIVVAGSVARDFADEYSDLEIPIFWEELPEDATRHSIAEALNGSFVFSYDGPSREDQLLIRGLQVDLWHTTVRSQKATIKAVLREHHTDFGSLNAMDTIRCCIPLYGEKIVDDWKHRAQEYPEEVAERIIQEHLSSFRIDQLSMHAQRGDPTSFYAQLSSLQQEVFLILLALNRLYFPTYKWLYQSLERMRIKPHQIGERFRQAFSSAYAEAIADMKRIMLETLGLVEGRHPDTDTTSVHRRLSYLRTPLKAVTFL